MAKLQINLKFKATGYEALNSYEESVASVSRMKWRHALEHCNRRFFYFPVSSMGRHIGRMFNYPHSRNDLFFNNSLINARIIQSIIQSIIDSINNSIDSTDSIYSIRLIQSIIQSIQ